MADGKRKITNISEVVGIKNEDIILKTIFEFKQKGLTLNGEVDGEFTLINRVPDVYKKIVSRGIKDIDDIDERLN